jgi:hypothetical protein
MFKDRMMKRLFAPERGSGRKPQKIAVTFFNYA